jgi:nicotinamide riboside kinase
VKLISFTGAQSSGKTTLLNKCKDELPGKWYYVDEVTRYVKRRYGESINEQGTDMTQLMIINTHIENSYLINTLDNSYDGVILDRCIVDGLVYTEWLHEQGHVSKWVLDYAKEIYNLLLPKLDIILYTDPNIPLIDDGERSINVEFKNDIVQKFENIFNTTILYAHKLSILSGDVDSRYTTALSRIIP